MKKVYFLLFIANMAAIAAQAQVTISPTNIFINSQSRFGSYMVMNGSNKAQEVTINFVFGYIKRSPKGGETLIYNDSTKAKKYSAASWVRAFPKKFTLQPGQRQTIRLRVFTPDTLDDGVYWARIKTTSSPASPPVGTKPSNGISARVNFKLQQVTGLYYKSGNVTTGINIKDLSVLSKNDSTVTLLAHIKRTGNAPFLGTIYANIYNQNNKLVASSQVATTVYFGGGLKQQVNISHLPAGNYRAEMRFETHRNDIDKNDLVHMQPVSKSINITLSE